MKFRPDKFYARRGRNFPKGLPYAVTQYEYLGDSPVTSRCICYCFDRTYANSIARALNSQRVNPWEGKARPKKKAHNGAVQTSWLEQKATGPGSENCSPKSPSESNAS